MDKLAYTYEAESNQLAYVADKVAPSAYPNDIDGQAPDNYEYNKIGQLTYNKQDNLGYAYYTSGLTKAIYNGRVETGTKRVEFQYNESGHRIKKLSYNQEGQLLKTTFYVRDAAGTPLAIYYKDEGNTDKSIILAENMVYGGSRLGVANRITETMLYEITDHLGNVRAVVTKAESGEPIAVMGTADYYPFGMQFPNQSNLDYRYAYQGQEKDEETNMEAFQLRLWDARIGRWLTPDPYGEFYSPYLGMGNDPVNNIDRNGGCVECPEEGKMGDKFVDSGGDNWEMMDGMWGYTHTTEFSDYGSGMATRSGMTFDAAGAYMDMVSKHLSSVDYSLKGYDLDVHMAKAVQRGVPTATIGKVWSKQGYQLEKQVKNLGSNVGKVSKYVKYGSNGLGALSMGLGTVEHFYGNSGKTDARYAVDQAFNAMGLSKNPYLVASSLVYNGGYILEDVLGMNLQMNAKAIHPPHEIYNPQTGESGLGSGGEVEWVIEWDKLFDGPIGR